MTYFRYGQEEISYLSRADPELGAAIDSIGKIERELTFDPFQALVFSIISQQISKQAAATVKNRLIDCLGQVSPQTIARTERQALKSCGLSERKVSYIFGLADAALSGTVDFQALSEQSDQEIITILSSLYGVGVWTAEMILIFSLGRPDIVSYHDLAIRRGMVRLYNLPALDKAIFDSYRLRYSPYGSVASLYLWAISAT